MKIYQKLLQGILTCFKHLLHLETVGSMLRRRRSSRKKRLSAEAVLYEMAEGSSS
jgi:hypothetical protein